ncbi:MAG: hypothetical protein ACM3TT_01245 [Syntrophothermus sp.]
MFDFLNVFFFFWGIGALLGLLWVFVRYGIPILAFGVWVLWQGVITAKNAFMEGWEKGKAELAKKKP